MLFVISFHGADRDTVFYRDLFNGFMLKVMNGGINLLALQAGGTAQPDTFSLRGLQSRFGPFADKGPLELGKGRHHVKHQFSAGGALMM